jgi:hypothetical protein
MNRKAFEMTFSLIVKIILGIFVLFAIFYFLFFNQINDFFNNLPGNYKYDNSDKVIDNISKDDQVLVNYYKVAVIQDGKYVKFCTIGDCNNLRSSSLYWYGDENSGGIYVDVNWAFDKKIADIANNKVKINSEVLNGQGVYEKVKDKLPPYEDMINLDNSIYISGILYREKRMVVTSGEKVFGKTTIVAPADRGVSFYEKINSLKVGEVFVADGQYQFQVSHMFSQETFDCIIRFEKINDNEFKAEAGYLDSEGKQIWHQLDCNKKGWVGKTIVLDMFKKSMIETIDENCKW